LCHRQRAHRIGPPPNAVERDVGTAQLDLRISERVSTCVGMVGRGSAILQRRLVVAPTSGIPHQLAEQGRGSGSQLMQRCDSANGDAVDKHRHSSVTPAGLCQQGSRGRVLIARGNRVKSATQLNRLWHRPEQGCRRTSRREADMACVK
jgi:hypothetical protein